MFRNGKTIVGKVVSIGKEKVVYMVPPDSLKRVISNWKLNYVAYPGGTKYNFAEYKKPVVKISKSEFYLSANAGFTVPSLSYRDGIVGTHFGCRATYYFNSHIGIAANYGVDLNGTGLNYISNDYWGGFYIFQQYLIGLTYRTGGRPGYPWVDFVGLLGACNATSPVSEQGGGNNGLTVYTPGNGNGFGGYFGLDFTSSENHLCSLTFGAGCLIAVFSYPNYTNSYTNFDPYTNVTSNNISESMTKTTLALPELYLAINFKLKKAQH